MPIELKMPALSPTMEEGTLAKWLVKEGDTVMHERWGEGVIVQMTGNGEDAEATIRFADVGEKRVLLAYAPLKKVG